jgi:DNA-directed RNA polymerase II subunit RPB2
MISRGMEVLEEYEPMRFPNSTKVFVNGVWVGVHPDPRDLVREVQATRRNNIISTEVSLVRDIRDREFKIFSDAGRVMRPLFVVEQGDNPESQVPRGALHLTKEIVQRLTESHANPSPDPEERFGWEELTRTGVIELLDAEEEETAMICMTPEDLENYRLQKMGYQLPDEQSTDLNKRLKTKMNPGTHTYTHCEIHPSMILGICASIIPFPDHNQVGCLVVLFCRRMRLTCDSRLVTRTSRPWASKRWAFS